MGRWMVDGMNVIGSRPDGWWRDRRGAAERLAADLGRWAAREGASVLLVLDGRPFALRAPAGVTVAFAPRGGRNAADDEIARRVDADPDPGAVTVVTSDGELARRVRAAGAAVEGAGAFRGRLDATR